jgi:hypothetical protein
MQLVFILSLSTMKRIVLSLLTALTMGYTAQAQVSLIAKAGLTLSNVAFKETKEGQQSVTGFLFGAGFNFPIGGESFSIQPELLYLQKGFGLSESNQGVKTDGKYTLNYLEIPLLAKVAFGSESVKVYLNAGPSLGYGLTGNANAKTNFFGAPLNITVPVKFGEKPENADEGDIYPHNRIDLGVQFGGGLAFKAGPGSLILNARYGYSLTDTYYEVSSGNSTRAIKSQNRTIALSLGYAIPLGGK